MTVKMFGAAWSVFGKSTTMARGLVPFFLLLSSVGVVCDGGGGGVARQTKCSPDQYVDPISPQFCKSCVELCDIRREPSLESCKFRCPDYHKQLEIMSTMTTQEPDDDPRVFDPGLYIGIGVGLGALVIIGSLAGYVMRRHRAGEADVNAVADPKEMLQLSIEVSEAEREPQEVDSAV